MAGIVETEFCFGNVAFPFLSVYTAIYLGLPFLHDASANKNVHVSNAFRTTHPETHLEKLVCVVLVLVAVRFALWTMMAELCLSVDDSILDFFSNAAADTASEYDSYGHRRCWTAATSCPYYSCRHHAMPVGHVLPRVGCSRTRAKTASI